MVQQWMCEAMVVPSKPAKITSTVIAWAARSKVTNACPVPGDAFGGASFGPLSCAIYVIGAALTEGDRIRAAASAAALERRLHHMNEPSSSMPYERIVP